MVAVVYEGPTHIYEPILEQLPEGTERFQIKWSGKKLGVTGAREFEGLKSEVLSHDFVMVIGAMPFELITGGSGVSKGRGKVIKEGNTLILPTLSPGSYFHNPKLKPLVDRDIEVFHEMINSGGLPSNENLDIHLISSLKDLVEFENSISSWSALDTETTCLSPFQEFRTEKKKHVTRLIPHPAKMVSLGVHTGGKQFILLIDEELSGRRAKTSIRWARRMLVKLKQSGTKIATHNGKFDSLWCWVTLGIRFKFDFDTMYAAYILDENQALGLKALAQIRLKAPEWDIDVGGKQGVGIKRDQHVNYLANDVYYTDQLRRLFVKEVRAEPDLHRYLKHYFIPMANLYVEMEYNGVPVRTDRYKTAQVELARRREEALNKLAKWQPKGEFNWGSSDQVSTLLYDKMKIPVKIRTESGSPSVNESALKRMEHPVAKVLLQYRAATQAINLFMEGWKDKITRQGGGDFIHPTFKVCGTVTGRPSCEDPNLQQVIREPLVRNVLDSHDDDWVLVEFDLSQVELRIAAELAHERVMLKAFRDGVDIHWLKALREIQRGRGYEDLVIETAIHITKKNYMEYDDAIETLVAHHAEAEAFNIEWKELRKKAKAVNFGYLYGMWWKKFLEYAFDNYDLTLTNEEAADSRKAFFEDFPDLTPWHKRQSVLAARHGEVTYLSGRKRRVPEAMGRGDDYSVKRAQRQAINSPVQGFAAEINLMAALEINDRWSRDQVRLVATVHDAILVLVHKSCLKEVYPEVLKIMSQPKLFKKFNINLTVPLEADGSIGPWGSGVSLERYLHNQSL